MIKFIQSTQYINKDLNMFHAESNTPALARTSNLNEELGQVNFYLTNYFRSYMKIITFFLKDGTSVILNRGF